MQIIKDRQLVEDSWVSIAGDTSIDALPAGDIIVSLALWQEHKDVLSQRDGAVGVALAPEEEVESIAADLDKLALVALQFPAFRDGRGYSQARNLRLHYGYQGEIRATGNVLRDQVGYMERVGINSFVIDEKQDTADALKAFDEFSIKYQASSDEPLPLFKRRTA